MRLFKKPVLDPSPQLVSAISIEHDAGVVNITDKLQRDVKGSNLKINLAGRPQRGVSDLTTNNLRKDFSTWSKRVGRKWHQLRKADSTEFLSVSGRIRHWSPNRKSHSEDEEIKDKNSSNSPKSHKLLRVESLRNLFRLGERSNSHSSASNNRNNSEKYKEHNNSKRTTSTQPEDVLDLSLYHMNKTLSDGVLRNVSQFRSSVNSQASTLNEKKDHLHRAISNLQEQQRVLDYILNNQNILRTTAGTNLARDTLARLASGHNNNNNNNINDNLQCRTSTEALHLAGNDDAAESGNKLLKHVKKNLFKTHGSRENSATSQKPLRPGLEDLLIGLRLGCDESGYDTDSTRAGADSPDSGQRVEKPRSFSITSEDFQGVDLSGQNANDTTTLHDSTTSTIIASSPHTDKLSSSARECADQINSTLEASVNTDATLMSEADTDSCDSEKFEAFVNSRMDLRIVDNTVAKKSKFLCHNDKLSKSTINLTDLRSKNIDDCDGYSGETNLKKFKKRSLPSLDDSTSSMTYRMRLQHLQDSIKAQVKSRSAKLSHYSVLSLLDNAASPNKDSPPATKIKPNTPAHNIAYYSPKRSRSKMEPEHDAPTNRAKRPTPAFRVPNPTSKLLAHRELKTIKLFIPQPGNLGISVERQEAAKPFFIITKVDPKGEGAKSKLIRIGDEIVRVCGRRLRGMSVVEARNALKSCVGSIELQVAREPKFVIKDESSDTWTNDPLVRTKSDSDVWSLNGTTSGAFGTRTNISQLQFYHNNDNISINSNDNIKNMTTDVRQNGELTKNSRAVSMNAVNVLGNIEDMDTQPSSQKITGMRKFQVVKKRSTGSTLTLSRQSSSFAMEILTVVLEKGASKKLGFSIVGGSDSNKGNMGIYIKDIIEDGQAAEQGTLKVGDEVLAVNGQNVAGLTHARVLQIFKIAKPGKMTIQIGRRDSSHKRLS